MRRDYAKKVIDEKIINVERIVAVLFVIGRKYGVQLKGERTITIVGNCVFRDEHKIVLESTEFQGFDTESTKNTTEIKTKDIAFLWEIKE